MAIVIILLLSIALLFSTAISYHLYTSRSKQFIPIERHEKILNDAESSRTVQVASLNSLLQRAEQKVADCDRRLEEMYRTTESKADQIASVRLEAWKNKEEKKIREDAIKRSANTVKGKVSEHLTPFKINFQYNPRDCRFVGTPIDYLIFDGLENDDVKEVVFLEVKTGEHAKLTTRERSVRDAIREGRVRWEIISILPEGKTG